MIRKHLLVSRIGLTTIVPRLLSLAPFSFRFHSELTLFCCAATLQRYCVLAHCPYVVLWRYCATALVLLNCPVSFPFPPSQHAPFAAPQWLNLSLKSPLQGQEQGCFEVRGVCVCVCVSGLFPPRKLGGGGSTHTARKEQRNRRDLAWEGTAGYPLDLPVPVCSCLFEVVPGSFPFISFSLSQTWQVGPACFVGHFDEKEGTKHRIE